MEGTKIYGQSDDNVYFEGDVRAQYSQYGTDDKDTGILIVCSDGTILEAKYGKNDSGIWEIKLRHKGSLFDKIDQCTDEEADPYSDVAHFKPGLKWAYACSAENWEKVS